MQSIHDFDVYIFDCDGVILDSNELKIEAMKNSLLANFSASPEVDQCISYFRDNFGKSRFHHVAHFLDNILPINSSDKQALEQSILNDFSKQCRTLYLSAEITSGFIDFLGSFKGKKYVASGSEQSELREVFSKRGLDKYFDGVFGSPVAKSDNVKHILKIENSNNAVMFGDALSDLNAAVDNSCFFAAYLPLSNVKECLEKESARFNFNLIYSWNDVKC